MSEREHPWTAPLGVAVVLLIVLSIVLSATGQWKWFSDSAAASWVQAVVSILAIGAGAAAVYWQVKRQAVLQGDAARQEEARKLRIVGAALFHCRVSVEQMQDAPAYSIASELQALRVRLNALQSIPVLDYPDWRALHGVANAADSLASVEERIAKSDVGTSLRAVQDREKYLNVVLNALEFAEELVHDALLERDSDLDAISMKLETRVIYSRSYPRESGPKKSNRDE